jgi:secondary thiamine-phosphate synthase enzyme
VSGGRPAAHRCTIRTTRRTEFVDITAEVRRTVRDAGLENGFVVIFVPHTTAGVTVNENADPDVTADLAAALDRAVPWSAGYRHGEGNSAAHAKASLMGSSVTVPVAGGELLLGTWQAVYFCEFDGPRTREYLVGCAPA